MSSTIHLTPLSGAQNQGPQCHLLRLDNFLILLDCGWDERFDVKAPHLQQLKRLAPQIDAILLSHSSLHHLGALPYLVQHLKCNAPIYCTTPIWTMGETFLEESLSWNIQATEIFSVNDIHETFKRINRMRYQERVFLGEAKDVQIVPFSAGHTLGATVWKLSKETDDIIYAIDYNHRKEIICDACRIDKLGKPSILITDSFMASNEAKVKDSPKEIVDKTMETLRLGGNVLIPSDTAGRCFELMFHLERAWKQRPGLSNYGLVFLSKMSLRSITSASNQLEWMGESFRKEHEDRHSDPMSFEHVRILRKLSMLEGVKHPVCVIAATETLNSGFSLALFRIWGQHKSNRVILTDKNIKGSNVRKLIEGQRQIDVKIFKKVALQGEELEEHLRQKRADEEVAKLKAREAEQRKEVIQIRDEAEQEEELEAPSHDQLYLPENMRYHSQYPMFPCIERHLETSIYGIVADELITKRNFMEEIQEQEDRAALEREQTQQVQPEEQIPFKIVEENVSIEVVCPVDYIEFSGRSNGTSVRNIIQQMHPRKLVLIHGTPQDSEMLRKFCVEKKLCEQIEVPHENQVVDISMDTNMIKVKLREQLLSNTRFVKAGTFDLGFIEGLYEYPKVEEPNQEDGTTATSADAIPFIAPRATNKGHHTILLGEIKLHNLSNILRKKGFKVKFKIDGGLIVNGNILITLDSSEKVNIEGSLCKDYFDLRQIVYTQFQVL